jgi:[ribosomal protein S18]-alanine N-acetyltransferase
MSSPATHEPAHGRGGAVAIRAMRPADLPQVMSIEHASYTMPWSEPTFRSLLRRADAELIVAAHGDEVAGYAAAWYVLDQAELGNVAVAEPWRRRGIGALLVDEALHRAGRRGVREVFLEVRPSNAAARQLYARFAFREVGRRTGYYSRPVEDALVLRRMLAADCLPVE